MASNGNKKHGRNEAKCKSYRASGQREKNARAKAQRHAKRAARFAARRSEG